MTLLHFSALRGGTPAASGDTTAPVLTSAVGTTTGSTTATIGATTNEGNGTLYGVVTTSATQPSITQIKAGQSDGGTSAAYASSQSISSTGAKTFSATGLTASTTYYSHHVHTDAAGNNSNRITSSSFATDAAPGPSARAYTNTPVSGYGGIVMLETHIKWAEPGDTVSIWVGRWAGNSGQLTITWDCQDGHRAVTSAVTNYAGLSKTLTFADGEHGWKEIQIPLQTWTLTDRTHFVFRITNVTINNGADFVVDDAAQVYIRVDDGAIVNTNRLWCNKDAAGASDSNAGTEAAPFLTLQKLATEMVAQNKSGYVVAASTDYSELTYTAGDVGGMYINRTSGGAAYNDFLYLDGLTTSKARITTLHTGVPVINNSWYTNVESGTQRDRAGLYIRNGDSIWVCDLEIKNCKTGILCKGSTGAQKLVLERLHSHHHIGGDNIAGIRMDYCYRSIVHNCWIHNNYDNRSGSAANPYSDSNITAGSYSGQTIYGPHNGIQLFSVASIIIEYNYLPDNSKPVYNKHGFDAAGGFPFSMVQAEWVTFNRVERSITALYENGSQGVREGQINSLAAFNTAYKSGGFMNSFDGSASGGQADGMFIFNNSGHQAEVLFNTQGFTGVRCVDNIIHTPSTELGNSTPKLLTTRAAENGVDATFIDFEKGNTLYNFSSYEFILDMNGPNERPATSIAAWQSIYSSYPTPATTYMAENPGVGMLTTNPNFTAPTTNNFLRTGSPTDGYYGGYPRGAIVDAQTVVGNY